MVAQRPDVARPRDRLGRWLRDGVGGVIIDGRAVVVIGIVQQGVEFVLRDPDQSEIEILGQQPAQLFQQQGLVPAAHLRKLIVGDAIRAPLRFGQMAQNDHRGFGQPELRGRQDAAMPRDQLAVVGDKQGTVQPNSAMLAAILAT